MRCLDLETFTECSHLELSTIALGNFDGVHLGHRRLIAAGDGMCAVFTFSDLKSSDLICPLDERLALLRSAGARFAVVCDFDEVRSLSPAAFVDLLCGGFGASRIVCGYNFTFGANAVGHADDLASLCAERGVDCVIVPEFRVGDGAVSSSRIRDMIAHGDVEGAAALLGRTWGFSLPVVRGRQLGGEMGCPTANQILPECIVRPRFGVYASTVEIDGATYHGVTNVGICPTVGGRALGAESHIFDLDFDLYGKTADVRLVHFLRDERRFSSVDELFGQIDRDEKSARAYFDEKQAGTADIAAGN